MAIIPAWVDQHAVQTVYPSPIEQQDAVIIIDEIDYAFRYYQLLG